MLFTVSNRPPSPKPPPPSDPETLVTRLAEEMAEGWRAGRCPPAEEFLDRHPELWGNTEAAFDLIYEEVCLRRERGQAVSRDELLRRFPQWSAQLEILLNCHQVLEAGGPRFPRAGEMLRDFRLLAELGRGGQGVVFLAAQSSLADRPVVLKVTARRGDEHLSLARLQHTHIVPLWSAFDDDEWNLRALCMPYFGGLTLARALQMMQGRPVAQRAGKDFLDALDVARAEAPAAVPPCHEPARRFLAEASYPQVVAWVGACLAEALQYAHERGVVHLDLKPSNVLLTADGQPMLLDFHLAREAVPAGGPAGALFGGTPAYMSPEQAAALEAAKAGGVAGRAVDGRSDIYSLGLVLYEALGGAFPFPAGTAPQPLRRCNAHVPVGLSDIVARCLAADPAARYPSAGALAADLRAHLNALPLRGVPNRSLAERWRKWRRRRPHLLPIAALLTALVLACGVAAAVGLMHLNHRAGEARAALSEGRELLLGGRYAEAAGTFQRGLGQVEHVPGYRDLKGELAAGLRRASRLRAAQELHEIADRFRVLYGVDFFPSQRLRDLETRCRAFWEKRDLILDRLVVEVGPEVEQKIKDDLRELAVLGSDLHVRLAPAGQAAAARGEALQTLAEAEALFGPGPVLSYERAAHTGAQRPGPVPAPRTAWEHYALGRSLLRLGKLEEASALLDRAVELEPKGLWPQFYQGVCCYRRGRHADAALAFTFCVAVAPEVPACFYNRALAFAGLGRAGRALKDFDRALELDPGFAEAALNRGALNLREGRLAEAGADFRRALDSGGDPALAHYNLALLSLARKDPGSARSHVEQSLRFDPNGSAARALSDKLRAKGPFHPEGVGDQSPGQAQRRPGSR